MGSSQSSKKKAKKSSLSSSSTRRTDATSSSPAASPSAVVSSSDAIADGVSPRLLSLLQSCDSKCLPNVLLCMVHGYVGPSTMIWDLPQRFRDYGAYNDTPALLAKLPIIPGVGLYGLQVSVRWGDQGWGNAKGEVWFRLLRGPNDKEVAICRELGIAPRPVQEKKFHIVRSPNYRSDDHAGDHEGKVSWTAQSSSTSLTSSSDGNSTNGPESPIPSSPTTNALAKVPASPVITGPFPQSTIIGSDGEPITVIPSILIDESRGGDTLEIWRSIGGGGGHELTIESLRVIIEWVQ